MSQIMGGEKKSTGLGEASFSSYLSTADEMFVHKLAEPAIQHPHPMIAPSVGTRTPSRVERSNTQECEISVFGAEKYFNMKLDDGDDDQYINKHRLRKGNHSDLQHMTPRRWPATPTASSEASWNSQTALLRSVVRNRSESKHNKVNGRRFFSNLSCTGSCSDGKSVYVDHGKELIQINHRPTNTDRRRLPQAKFPIKDEFDSQSFDKFSLGSNREVYFGPPILKPGLQKTTVKTELDDPRKSLEVFGSSAIKEGDIAKNLEMKLSMLTWDAIPNAPTISSVSKSSQVNDDVESDASSDLFEIDNISSNGQALFTRQPSDGMSSCMTPYAPSEASIEWSVVTASAADCSFVSDYDEIRPTENSRAPGSKTASKLANTKVLQDKSRSGGILGCKSHKAIMVAESVYKIDGKSRLSQLPQLKKSTSPMPARLLQAGIRVKDLDFS